MSDKKIVVVSGASRGIGKAVAMQFAKSGEYTVIGTATTDSGAGKITESLSAFGGEGKALNVGDSSSVQKFVDKVIESRGKLDILVNNAGITSDTLLMRMKDEDWNNVLNINLTGTYLMSKAVLRPMMKQRWGRIINISSIVAKMGNAGQTNYVASKAGIEGFSRALALEVASRNITVNSVAPGFIDTDMTEALTQDQKDTIIKNIPMSSLGTPDDIANAVLFLASEGARYITGTIIPVNGGLSMA